MFNIYQIINLNRLDVIDCSDYLGISNKVLDEPFYCPICMENETNSVECNKCKNVLCKQCFDRWDVNKGCHIVDQNGKKLI